MFAANHGGEIKACLTQRVGDHEPHAIGRQALAEPDTDLVGMRSAVGQDGHAEGTQAHHDARHMAEKFAGLGRRRRWRIRPGDPAAVVQAQPDLWQDVVRQDLLQAALNRAAPT